jgi:hypothetical protein
MRDSRRSAHAKTLDPRLRGDDTVRDADPTPEAKLRKGFATMVRTAHAQNVLNLGVERVLHSRFLSPLL